MLYNDKYQKIRQEVKLYKIAQIELFSIRIARGLTFRRTVIRSDFHAIVHWKEN